MLIYLAILMIFLDYAWFTINKQGIEDRITFIKLMIDLVNEKIEQENN